MNNGPGPGSILTIHKPDFAAVSAGDLLCESEPYAAAFGLGGIERDKKILGIGDAEAAVFDADNEIRFGNPPSDADWLGSVGQ